jgi:hypothetical protein
MHSDWHEAAGTATAPFPAVALSFPRESRSCRVRLPPHSRFKFVCPQSLSYGMHDVATISEHQSFPPTCRAPRRHLHRLPIRRYALGGHPPRFCSALNQPKS